LTDDAEVRRAYLVAVVSVSQSGARKHPSQSPQEVISINGPFCQPPNVSSFRAVLTSGLVVLSWAPVATPTPTIASNKDYAALGAVDGYEIRQGTSWSTGRVLTKLASGSMFVLPPPAQSTATYMIRAVSRAGIKSAAAASVSLTEADVYVNSQFNRDESAGGFAGTRTNLTAVGSGSVGMSASSSTYEAAVFSGLTLRRHRVHVDVDALPHDTVETVAEQTWAIGDVQGDRRLVSGWGVNPWDPKPYVLGSDTELDQSLDGWVGRYQNGYAGGRDIEDVASWHLEYSLSTDGGGSYGSWTRFESPVSLVFNAIKIRIEMTGDATPATFAPQQRILLTEMKIRGIREIEVDEGSASTASGGTAVTYNFPFSAMPRVTANVRAGAAGDNVQLSAVNSTGFTARIFDSAGVGKAGSVMWHAVL
jgi:hypothetical protein